jgi:hypothetical protein
MTALQTFIIPFLRWIPSGSSSENSDLLSLGESAPPEFFPEIVSDVNLGMYEVTNNN